MKVLIIDDDPMILRMAGFILKKKGCQTVTAKSGEEGLRLLKEESPELVFIDIEMPVMNGIETLEALRNSGSQVRVCMMSGTVTDEAVDRAKQLGALGVIAKPLDAAEVYSIIEG